MQPTTAETPVSRTVTAFAAVYVIWGSTYLAIRYAVETLPPFLMAGTRFLTAGFLLLVWSRRRDRQKISGAHWRSAFLVGGLLLLGGNGGVTWAEQFVPSGVAALVVSSVPIWMVLVDWVRPGGQYPSHRVLIGLILGFAGMVLLAGQVSQVVPGEARAAWGVAALIAATISWAIGSVISRGLPLPSSKLTAVALEMIGGGCLLVAVGIVAREPWSAFASASARSLLGYLYLIFFGSLVGFTAYMWLLAHTSVAKASTYAYVNPIVAVALGWLAAGEKLTPRMLVGAAVVLAGVVLITMFQPRRPRVEMSKGVPD